MFKENNDEERMEGTRENVSRGLKWKLGESDGVQSETDVAGKHEKDE